jgi:hypothetical protein
VTGPVGSAQTSAQARAVLCNSRRARAHVVHRFAGSPGGFPESLEILRRALLRSRRTSGQHVGKSTNLRDRRRRPTALTRDRESTT